MADMELKIEQLTDAIRSLYSRPAMSQSEINNLMTSLAQKFENLSESSAQKLIGIVVNETKKALEDKHHDVRQQLIGFENLLKQTSSNISNPKMSMEITKILNEVSDMYTKLGNQEVALQKINQTLVSNKSVNPANEINKLSNDFNTFSRGFENITHTLNKNFADFLVQIKTFSSKEELERLQNELDTINGNVNSIISAIAIIDNKYRDLTGLVEAFNQKEATFKKSVDEINAFTPNLKTLAQNITNVASKDDVREIKERIGFVRENITTLNTNVDNSLTQSTKKLIEVLNLIDTKLSDTALKNSVNDLKNELKVSMDKLSISSGTNRDEIISKLQEKLSAYKSQSEAGFNEQLSEQTKSVNENISYLSSQLSKMQDNIGESLADKTQRINQDTLIVKEKLDLLAQNIDKLPKESVIAEMKALDANVRDIKDAVSILINQINQNNEKEELIIKQSNEDMIIRMKESFIGISDKFEELKARVMSSNAESFALLRNDFKETSETIKSYLEDTGLKLKDEIKNSYSEPLAEIKIDMQTLSNHLIESVENINSNISKEFEDYKTQIGGFIGAIEQSALNNDNTEVKDSIYAIKEDIVEGILANTKNNRTNFNIIEEKINEVISRQMDKDESANRVLLELINNALEKIEHTNQQQIHNAKELLDEIQTNSTEIIKKIEADAKKEARLKESVEYLKGHFETLTKDFREDVTNKLQEISLKQDKEDESAQKERPEVDEYISKLSEYLANVEFLKNNLGADLKECLEIQINDLESKLNTNVEKIASDISHIISSDKDADYSYSLQDVESDIAKLRLSIEKDVKNDYKEFINRLIELKNISLESNKLNHSLDNQLGQLSMWFKAASQKFEVLTQQVESTGRISMEEIKTRLIRSERSSDSSKTEEFGRRQMSYLEDLDEKLNLIIQKQNSELDPASFIDVTYENMKQTKELARRMNDLELKIDKIQGYMEKIINYIEE